MTYLGTFVNGDVQLNDQLIRLPEGVRVHVQVEAGSGGKNPPSDDTTSYQRYLAVIGSIKDAPADLASEHDRFLYAAEKAPGE